MKNKTRSPMMAYLLAISAMRDNPLPKVKNKKSEIYNISLTKKERKGKTFEEIRELKESKLTGAQNV